MYCDHITKLRPTYASNQRRNYACLANGREQDIPSFGAVVGKGGREIGEEARYEFFSQLQYIRSNLHGRGARTYGWL